MKNKTYPYIILLAGLPKGIAEKACRNAELLPYSKYIETDESLVSDALLDAFWWRDSHEGEFYWNKIHNNLRELGL